MDEKEIYDYISKPEAEILHNDLFNALAAELRGRNLNTEYETIKKNKDRFTAPYKLTKEFETLNKALTEVNMSEAALP